MNLPKISLYLAVAALLFAGQFLYTRGLATGKPPALAQSTIKGEPVAERLANNGPRLIYFWAEWCRICSMMQEPIDSVAKDVPVLTVALKSGDSKAVAAYLGKNGLDWPTVNDENGDIGARYGIKGVPAVFVLNEAGNIVFTSVGYSTEWGLRLRLWLAGFF